MYFQLFGQNRVQILRHHAPDSLHTLLKKIAFYMKYPFQINLVLAVNTLIVFFTELYIGTRDQDAYDRFLGQPHWLLAALSFMEANYQKRITVEEIAENSNLSASHFSKLFKEYTQLSPYDSFLKVRINKAMLMLENTDYPVKQIARPVGYPSVNDFCAQFRKLYDVSPQELRKTREKHSIKELKESLQKDILSQ